MNATTAGSGHQAECAQWRTRLAPYAEPNLRLALLSLATSVAPYLGLSAAMYFLLPVSPPLVAVLAIPTAAFLVRTFIVFHDCSHGSFLPSRRGNAWLGTALGLLLYSPFLRWQHDHAVHHASAGDLDRRGVGDIKTLTVAEYEALSRKEKRSYRLQRHPAAMFILGPVIAMIIGPRMSAADARPRMRRSVRLTNLALLVLVGGLCLLMGWLNYVIVVLPPALLAGSIGIWLFYVQHQFEDAYWERSDGWSYVDAALHGSSFLKLPPLLRFCTGNIGYHHVHHLNARVPSYNLPSAHEDNPAFEVVPVLTLGAGLRAVRLKLWDEDTRRMVTFAEARAAARSRSAVLTPAAAETG